MEALPDEGPWITKRQTDVEPVKWDTDAREYQISLFGIYAVPSDDPDMAFRVRYRPKILYALRVRKAGGDAPFGPWYISPSKGMTLLLDRGEEYEAEIQPIDAETGKPLPDQPLETHILKGESE